MTSVDFKDLYIKYPGDPSYRSGILVEDDVINVIIQKYEIIIFTNKGEVIGDPNLGCDLEFLLYQTKVSENYVKSIINQQISIYIPELLSMNYSLQVIFTQDSYNFQDIMFIYLQLGDHEVYAQIGSMYGGF